jgi:hypothetical protein
MINKNKVEKYDKSHRIVLFQTNKKGECVPQITSPEIANEMVDTLYEERADNWKNNKEELNKGNISPVCLFFRYHNMNIKDVASRMQISPSKVKKHLTMKGFMKLDLITLKKYASIFDASIGDFFQFIHIQDNIEIAVNNSKNKITQDIYISLNKKNKRGKK